MRGGNIGFLGGAGGAALEPKPLSPSDDCGGSHCILALNGLGAVSGPACGTGKTGWNGTGMGWFMASGVGLACGGGGVGLKFGGFACATGLRGANGLVGTTGVFLATSGGTN